jgi:hypothetical protein
MSLLNEKVRTMKPSSSQLFWHCKLMDQSARAQSPSFTTIIAKAFSLRPLWSSGE